MKIDFYQPNFCPRGPSRIMLDECGADNERFYLSREYRYGIREYRYTAITLPGSVSCVQSVIVTADEGL